MKKIGFISLGCPKNLVDSEVMMGQLKQAGYEITANADDADTVVLRVSAADGSLAVDVLAPENEGLGALPHASVDERTLP